MSALYRYALGHWRGKLGLGWSFWLNFVALSVLLFAVEPLCLPPYLEGEGAVTIAILAYLAIKFALFPWQAIGLLRASSSLARSNRLLLTSIQVSVVLGIGVLLLSALGSVQALQHYRQSLLVAEVEPPGYTVEWLPRPGLLHLRGDLDVGVTAHVAEWLESVPGITGIVLDSAGGQVYEGRGLALQIRRHALDTLTSTECLSACTTAFVAGARRSLGRGARLGFHGYKLHVGYPRIDVGEEQQKDREIFLEQGVAAEFIERIHSRAPEDMWWPTPAELLDAGVVHAVDVAIEN